MRAIQQITDKFIKAKFYNGYIPERFKEEIDSKLDDFNSDNDKLIFLNILKTYDKKRLKEHNVECSKSSCKKDDEHETLMYYIDGFINKLNLDETDDYYTYEERESISTQLDKILKEVEKLRFGQEVIHDEVEEDIEDLKSNLNLTKKNWADKVKGKAFTWVMEKTVNKFLIKSCVELVDNQNFTKFIDS